MGFYEHILHLEALETPWGPTAPIRFYSLGGDRELHVGLTDRRTELDKNAPLAFAVHNVDAHLRFLRERSVAYMDFSGSRSGPQLRPDGVRQVYLQDPDGSWIEISDAAHPQAAPKARSGGTDGTADILVEAVPGDARTLRLRRAGSEHRHPEQPQNRRVTLTRIRAWMLPWQLGPRSLCT